MQEKELKDLLLQQQQVLLSRIERIGKHTRQRSEPLPADFAEQAIELENQETLESIESSSKATLDSITRALRRVDAGLAGVCETCNEPIDDARLRVLPYATACKDCVELNERKS